MLGIIPKNTYPLSYYRNWHLYENILKQYDKINFYFGKVIKTWIDWCGLNNINPLEISIILDFFSNNSHKFEKILSNFEKLVGKNILLNYISEFRGIARPEEVTQKLASLNSESYIYEVIKNNTSQVKKINSIGDWETDSKVISVKSILELDLNYKIIENFLCSLFYIKEYCIIRKYSSIIFNKSKNINSGFRKTILNYLRENIISLLERHDKLHLQYPELGKHITYNVNDLNITIDTYINNQPRIIRIFIQSYNNLSEIEIEFIEEEMNNLYSIAYNTNSFFFGGNNIDKSAILKKIRGKIYELDKNYTQFMECQSEKIFEGWIPFLIHQKDIEYFYNNANNFLNEVREIRKTSGYKIFLYYLPEWDNEKYERKYFEI